MSNNLESDIIKVQNIKMLITKNTVTMNNKTIYHITIEDLINISNSFYLSEPIRSFEIKTSSSNEIKIYFFNKVNVQDLGSIIIDNSFKVSFEGLEGFNKLEIERLIFDYLQKNGFIQ